jgi:hypothetical protein
MGNSFTLELLKRVGIHFKNLERNKMQSFMKECESVKEISSLVDKFKNSINEETANALQKFHEDIKITDLNLYPKKEEIEIEKNQNQIFQKNANEGLIAGFENPHHFVEYLKSEGISI